MPSVLVFGTVYGASMRSNWHFNGLRNAKGYFWEKGRTGAGKLWKAERPGAAFRNLGLMDQSAFLDEMLLQARNFDRVLYFFQGAAAGVEPVPSWVRRTQGNRPSVFFSNGQPEPPKGQEGSGVDGAMALGASDYDKDAEAARMSPDQKKAYGWIAAQAGCFSLRGIDYARSGGLDPQYASRDIQLLDFLYRVSSEGMDVVERRYPGMTRTLPVEGVAGIWGDRMRFLEKFKNFDAEILAVSWIHHTADRLEYYRSLRARLRRKSRLIEFDRSMLALVGKVKAPLVYGRPGRGLLGAASGWVWRDWSSESSAFNRHLLGTVDAPWEKGRKATISVEFWRYYLWEDLCEFTELATQRGGEALLIAKTGGRKSGQRLFYLSDMDYFQSSFGLRYKVEAKALVKKGLILFRIRRRSAFVY